MAYLITKGLHAPHMQYYNESNVRPTILLWAGHRTSLLPLEKISNENGETKHVQKTGKMASAKVLYLLTV